MPHRLFQHLLLSRGAYDSGSAAPAAASGTHSYSPDDVARMAAKHAARLRGAGTET